MRLGYIDMHCDSLLKSLETNQLYNSPGNMLDVSRMVLAGQIAQFFAVFFPPQLVEKTNQQKCDQLQSGDEVLFDRARRLLLDTVSAHSDVIRMAYSVDDIERNQSEGCSSAILTIEDARAVNGNMSKLYCFFKAGVRVFGLTWNSSNCFGYPNSRNVEKMNLGLTDFGKEAVLEMNRLGAIIDVSHLSDGGFWDVSAISKKPFVATHSNCRSLCDQPRNLSDDMTKAIAESGGVAGVNFAPEFLSPNHGNRSRVRDICRHIKHFIDIGGEECAAIGSDFDGICGQFEIGQPSEMHAIFDALKEGGLTSRQIEKVAFGNVLRVIRECC